jgi:DNA-directed RNA polymerase subunit RPC12/RpoP
MVFDSSELDGVKCPNGHRLKATIAEARRSASIRCPRCGARTTFDGRQADTELQKVDRAFADLKKSLDNFGR